MILAYAAIGGPAFDHRSEVEKQIEIRHHRQTVGNRNHKTMLGQCSPALIDESAPQAFGHMSDQASIREKALMV
jgi:hypothetical protein